MFSRTSSNTDNTTGVVSARISAHLRSSLMRTPSERRANILTSTRGGGGKGGGDGGDELFSPPVLALDLTNLSHSGGAHHRLHSARHGPGHARRGEKETAHVSFDLDSASSEVRMAAEAMSREELENAVKALLAENRMLLNTVLLDRKSLAMLQEGMRETYEAVEKEGESIANHLTRRMDTVRRQKAELEARLRNEEKMKAEQEQKLVDLRRSCAELTDCLRREEQLMKLLPDRLQEVQNQRQFVENILSEQSSSLQQLQELVDNLQPHGNGGNSHISSSAALSGAGVDSLSSLSSSKVAENIDLASEPQEMLQYLKQQLSVVEALQQEACKRAEMYKSEREELEQQICQAKNERCSSRQSLENVHQELLVTNATVSELASAAEMAMEVEIDRRIHLGSRNPSTHSISFDFLTPKRSTESFKAENTEDIKGKQQQENS